MNIQNLRRVDGALRELRKISASLHGLHEAACNYGLTPRQEKRETALKERARVLARSIGGVNIYVQGDPRGCALYLVPAGWSNEEASSRYTDGLAVY